MRKASILLVPCLIGGVLVAGCGGDDSSDSTSGEAALTKSEYLKQGNEICANAEHQISTAAQKAFGDKQPSEQQVVDFATDTAVPTIEDEISQLRDLQPPSGDEDTVNAIYDAAQEGVDALKQDPSIIDENNPVAFREVNKLAAAYGLNKCAD